MILSKTLKIRIALSGIWLVISILIAAGLAENSYNHWSILTFLTTGFILTTPIWLYWILFWIFGDGFLLRHLNRDSILLKQWKFSVTVLWLLITLIVCFQDKFTLENFSIEFVIFSSPAWGYWIYSSIIRKRRLSPEYVERERKSTIYHPWRRFFARIFDLFIFGWPLLFCLAWLVEHYIEQSTDNSMSALAEKYDQLSPLLNALNNPAATSIIVACAWIPFETLIMSLFGYTPGKLLFGIKVRELESGNKLSLKRAFIRSASVASKGLFFGVPLLNLATMTNAQNALLNTGSTSWDAGKNSVVMSKLSGVRQALAFCLIACVLMANSYSRNLKVDDFSEYKANTKLLSQLQQDMTIRANKLWHNLNIEISRINGTNPDQVNSHELDYLAISKSLAERNSYAEILEQSKKDLLNNTDEYLNDIRSSKMQPGFKQTVSETVAESMRDVKTIIGNYLDALEAENRKQIFRLEFLRRNLSEIEVKDGEVFFSSPVLFEQYKQQNNSVKSAISQTAIAKTSLQKFVEQSDTDSGAKKDSNEDMYVTFRSAFEVSPSYPFIKIFVGDDQSKFDELYNGFLTDYKAVGSDQAASKLNDKINNMVTSKLAASLPVASNLAIYEFGQAFVSIAIEMQAERPDLCSYFFDDKDSSKNFGGWILNDAKPQIRENYLKALNDVVHSASQSPSTYTLSKNQIDEYSKNAALKGLAPLGVRAKFLFDHTSPTSPSDRCAVISGFYGAVLNLKSPAREDVLREILTDK